MTISNRSQRNHSENIPGQDGTARIVPVMAILFLIALAALAAPPYQDRDHDRDHDRARGGIHVSDDRIMRDFGGGRGGRPSRDALCDSGFVAIGFHVQIGEFYNEAWLECAPLRPDGWIGEDRRVTERTGSRGGRPIGDAYCPEGMALRGLRGRTGASIDEAAGECSPIREIAERREHPRTEPTQLVAIPHPGGRPAWASCPDGSVITGLRSSSGEYMDHLWILCSELRNRDRDNDRDRR